MNKGIIMGRLAADPELRRTGSDLPVCSFTVAVNRPKQKDGTAQTDWIDCVAWRGTAEFICRYFEKGKPILLEGSLQTRSYEDKGGNKRKAVELLVQQVDFCGGNEKRGSEQSNHSSFQMPPDEEPWESADADLPF